MLLRQPPRPHTFGKVTKWFRFADSPEWIAQNVFDEPEGSQNRLLICLEPVP
jgi:hypothetical protein